MNFMYFQSTVPTCAVWIHEHECIYLHMFMQIRRTEAYVIQITAHTLPMHQNTTHSPQLAHTHTNAQAGISHCVFLWTWRTGRKQQDAVSMMPALTRALTFSSASFLQRLSFSSRPLCHTVLLFVSFPDTLALILETCLCTKLSQDMLRGMREKGERWGGRQWEGMNRISGGGTDEEWTVKRQKIWMEKLRCLTVLVAN